MSAELRGASSSDESPGRAAPSYPPLPADALIIVPVRNLVLFPGMVFPLSVGRPNSIAAAQQAVRDQKQVGILLQRDAETATIPRPIDMHRVGTVANIARYVTAPDGSHHLVCQGEQRFQVMEFLEGWPFLVAQVLRIPEADVAHARDRGALRQPQGASASRRSSSCRRRRPNCWPQCNRSRSPGAARRFRRRLHGPDAEREAGDPRDASTSPRGWTRCSRSSPSGSRCCGCRRRSASKTKAALDERQREVLLREQMAAIQRQLGEARKARPRDRRARRGDRQGGHAEGGRGAGAQGIAPAASACRKRRPNTAWCAPISTG